MYMYYPDSLKITSYVHVCISIFTVEQIISM